ncbi:MAG: hypothetical protein IPG75_10135 [Gemmatimonadetes bacterium]|nr:hypothetical protein [Gemmatimonadota bacterium]
MTEPIPFQVWPPSPSADLAWDEFIADHANVVLQIVLLLRTEADVPTISQALLSTVHDAEEDLGDSRWDTDQDQAVVVRSPQGNEIARLSPLEAASLKSILCQAQRSPVAFYSASRRLLVVALHSALERLLHRLQPELRRSPLPKAIRQFLERPKTAAPAGTLVELMYPAFHLGSPLDALDALQALDACRHIVVHQRGIIDFDYLRRVPSAAAVQGEFREVTYQELWRWQEVVMRVGFHLRAVAA